ncbi:DUF4198 domain-containing protein [Frigoriglobus tundricola]|uniref:Ring canal kelch-like protein n=1 Tax=Frigoriglobus tundricola TaxID=2774151 RepID=A0A6M5YRX1_9BACT|nr:DUF4198 domain-containing protein [Frigoriglobus tundricola]QJW96011.1 Ring canal kelch-like protein [Frigoriglobus tundricola]
MYRTFGALVIGLFAAAAAQAHYPFVVPDDKGESAKVVFSDTLEPDANVNIEKIASTKLTLRDATGKEAPLEWKKGDGFLAVNVPGRGDRVVYGTTDYGVIQKGDDKPFRLAYYPKATIGAASAKAVGAKLPLEIVAVPALSKVRFQVLAAGKPVADSEVTVLLPAGGKKGVKTDKDGYTPTFEGAGRYGVQAKVIDPKEGEHAGKKFSETRSYATLVCDVSK